MKSAALLGLALTGCVSMGDDAIRARFYAYEGRPIAELAARLGPPETQQDVGGEHWMAWQWRDLGNFGSAGYASLQCRLSARTDASGIVTKVNMAGNRGGCEQLSKLVK